MPRPAHSAALVTALQILCTYLSVFRNRQDAPVFHEVSCVSWFHLKWSGRRDLNPRPFAPQANALPVCATPRKGFLSGGGKGSRTPDLLNAIQALYQLSYTPTSPFAGEKLGYLTIPSVRCQHAVVKFSIFGVEFSEPNRYKEHALLRRGDRAAEGAALEMLCALTGTEGSNPSLSASFSSLERCALKVERCALVPYRSTRPIKNKSFLTRRHEGHEVF